MHEFVPRLPGNYYCVRCGSTPERAPPHCSGGRSHKFFHVHT